MLTTFALTTLVLAAQPSVESPTTAPDWSTGIGVAGLLDSKMITSTSVERRLVGDLWVVASVLGGFDLGHAYETVGSTVGGEAYQDNESHQLFANAEAKIGVRYLLSKALAQTSVQLTGGAFVGHGVFSNDVNHVADNHGLTADAGFVVDVPLVDALCLRLGTNVLQARWSSATTKLSPTETARLASEGEIGFQNDGVSVRAVLSPSLELRVFF